MRRCWCLVSRMDWHHDHTLRSKDRYGESISLLSKSPQDALWHASALEGQCTVQLFEAWTAGHGLVSASLMVVEIFHHLETSSIPLFLMRARAHGWTCPKSSLKPLHCIPELRLPLEQLLLTSTLPLSFFFLPRASAGTPHFFSPSGHRKAGDLLLSPLLSDPGFPLPLCPLHLMSRTVYI